MQPNQMPQYGQQPMMTPPPMGNVPVQLPKDPKPVGLIVGLIIAVLLFIAAAVFGLWAFTQMQDYKNNSDKKAAVAVATANEAQKKDLEAQFAEQEKSPNKTYTSPAQYGSVALVYPKTWSAYAVESDNSSQPVDVYFYPNFVPNVAGKNNYYLRMQELSASYESTLKTYQDKAKQGTVTISTFTPALVKNATPGVIISGQLETDKKGTLVILPVRDKTLKIWTESDAAAGDFTNTVLKNLTYSP